VEKEKTNLDLETDVNVGSVDGRTPPEGESTIRNLVETGSLSVGDWMKKGEELSSARTRTSPRDENEDLTHAS